MSYLVIPYMQVQRVNANTSYLTINSAFAMPAAQFGQALVHQCDMEVRGVSYIHHDVQMLGEFQSGKMNPQQRKGAVFINKSDYPSVSKTPSLSMQPTASAHLKCSLIIDIGDSLYDEDELDKFLKQGRFAGGEVIRYGRIKEVEKLSDCPVKKGFFLIDRSDMLGEKADIDQFISVLGQRFDEEKDNGWLTPYVIGYALISDIESRGGSRLGYKHAFCEPMLSVAQFKSMNSDFVYEQGFSFWMIENNQDYFLLKNYFAK